MSITRIMYRTTVERSVGDNLMVLKEAIELERVGKFEDALHILKQLNDVFDSIQRSEQIICLNLQSKCLWKTGKLIEAENRARIALELAENDPADRQGQADALNHLGIIYWYKGKMDKTEVYYQQSLALRREIGNPQDIAGSLNNLGIIHYQRGQLDKAKEYYQQCLALFKKSGNPHDIANALNNLGVIYYHWGELDKAEEYYNQSLALFKKINNPQNIATSLNNLGIISYQRGQLDKAEDYQKQSLALKEKIGNPYDTTETLIELVRVMLTRKSLDDAMKYSGRLNQLAKESKLPDIAVRSALGKSLLKLEQQELGSAQHLASKAVKQAAEIPHFELQVDVMGLLIRIFLEQFLQTKHPKFRVQIEELLEEIVQLSKREHLHRTYVETVFVQGMVKRALFDLQGATERFQLAGLLAEERGIRPVAKQAAEELLIVQQHMDRYQQLVFEKPDDYEQEQLQAVKSYLEKITTFL